MLASLLPEFGAVYFRVLGALILLPYNLNVSGLLGRGVIALIICGYLLGNNFDLSQLELNLGLNFIIGIIISFTLLFSFWSLLILFEVTENLRGMNYAVFFGSDDFVSSQQLAQGVRIILFVMFLEQDFLLKLIQEIVLSLTRIANWEALAQEGITLCLQSLELGFKLIFPIALCFLMIQLFFMFVNKLYPQCSFFSEIFFIKMIVLLLITSGVFH